MRNKSQTVAQMGLLLALVLALSILERLIPPLPALPPGVSLGLSNIVIMYCLFFLDAGRATGLAALKALFAALTRGAAAGLLSLCGGMLSVIVIFLLLKCFGGRLSYAAAGVCGAVAHNLGQLLGASLILSAGVFYYTPVLIISGIIMGAVTGTALAIILPACKTFRDMLQ